MKNKAGQRAYERASLFRVLFAIFLGSYLAIQGLSAYAQTAPWPVKGIRIVVPYGTGGTPDILARALAEKLRDSLNQPVIVDNKPGGGGVIAAVAVKTSPPDGYTLFMSDSGQLAVNPALKPDGLPYDPIKDFTPVIRVSNQAFSIFVNSSSPAKSIGELVELSKSAPKGLFYGTSGTGSVHHIGSERFKKLTGANISHVPYKGLQFSVPALLSNEIDILMTSATPLVAQLKAGKVRMLARASNSRSPLFPDVPTLSELGIPMTVSINVGIVVPHGTPAGVVQRLNTEIRKALNTPEVRQRVEGQDFDIAPGSSAEYASLIAEELLLYRGLVKDSNIKSE